MHQDREPPRARGLGGRLDTKRLRRILDESVRLGSMLNSVVVTVSIARQYAEVYSFCADPLNFGRWNLLPNALLEQIGGNEYLVDLPQGRMVMRFMQHNDFGVLDYQVYTPSESSGPTRPLR